MKEMKNRHLALNTIEGKKNQVSREEAAKSRLLGKLCSPKTKVNKIKETVEGEVKSLE